MISSRCLRTRRSLAVHSSEEFWGGRLDGVSGTLGFPLERRVRSCSSRCWSLRYRASIGPSYGVSLEGGHSPSLFGREAFASLDVSYTAATTLPPSRRCRLNRALFDELLLVTGLAPLLQMNLRAEPCETFTEDWLRCLHVGGLADEKEKGEHVRLDWKGEEPPSNMRDARAAAAPLALKFN